MKSNGRFSGEENRGNNIPNNKTEHAKLNRVREHIESFLKVESHYIQKPSTRQFLGPELNISHMYDLNQEKCMLNLKFLIQKGVQRGIQHLIPPSKEGSMQYIQQISSSSQRGPSFDSFK